MKKEKGKMESEYGLTCLRSKVWFMEFVNGFWIFWINVLKGLLRVFIMRLVLVVDGCN